MFVYSQLEMQFTDARTGIHNRIRSLYQRMLSKEEYKYSSDLWLKFIKFQTKHGRKDTAKQIFYTALRSCPGAKVCIQDEKSTCSQSAK